MAPTATRLDEQEIKLPPLRSLQDFFMDARFTMPTFNDPQRMKNRIVQNLLYYQTNYFIVAALALFAVCVTSPREFVYGGLAITVTVSSYIYAKKNVEKVKKFKDENPVIGAIVILCLGLMVIHFSGKMLIFLASTSLPIIGTLVHAACRMRNVSNKLNTLTENLGLTKTPMGLVLESLGHSLENPSREATARINDCLNTQKGRQRAALEDALQAAAGFSY